SRNTRNTIAKLSKSRAPPAGSKGWPSCSIGRPGLTNEYESSSMLHVYIESPGSVLLPGLHRAQSFSNEGRSAIPPRGRRLRIHTFAHVVGIVPGSIKDQFPELCILPHEFRYESVEQSKQVVADQHLAVAVRPRTDTDRGNLQPTRHGLRHDIRDRLDDDGKRSGVFER